MRTNIQSAFFAIAASAAASLCIAAAASPAAARGVSAPLTVAPKASSGSAASAKKICMKTEPITGSRLSRNECRTRAEWEADGFTVTTRAKAKAAQQR